MGFPSHDPRFAQALDYARRCIEPGDSVYAQSDFLPLFTAARPYMLITRRGLLDCDWVIYQKDLTEQFEPRILRQLKADFMAVLSNEVFVIFRSKVSRRLEKRPHPAEIRTSDATVWAQLDDLEKNGRPPDPRMPNQMAAYQAAHYDRAAAPVRFARDVRDWLFSPKSLTVGISGDGGFFSNFNMVMSHLVESLHHGGVRSVRVDWDVAQLLENSHFAAGHNFPYGCAGDGNAWEHFFKQPCAAAPSLPASTTHSFADMGITHLNAHYLYQSGNRWRRKYHAAYRRHIRVQAHIGQKVVAIHSERMSGRYCIGVHARNLAHRVEQFSGEEITFETYREKIDAALAGTRGDAAIFLATDVEEIAEQFRAVYGDKVFTQPGVTRLEGAQTGEFNHQLHHRNPHPGLKLGEDVLIDCLLLSRCDMFIHGVSNLATAAGYINPALRMVYCG